MSLAQYRLSTRFGRLVERRNMTQNEMAAALGITSGFMSQLLSGKRNAGPSLRRRIQATLKGFEFDDLFDEVRHD